MSASATVLSNNILFRAKRDNIQVTPMKLQKLLYYVCVYYVKQTQKMPISENFEVWKYGPVAVSVYAEFKPFKASPITKYALNATGKAMMVDEAYNPTLKSCLDYVWEKLKTFTGVELSKRTHNEGSGWYRAFQDYRETISLEDMLNDSTI